MSGRESKSCGFQVTSTYRESSCPMHMLGQSQLVRLTHVILQWKIIPVTRSYPGLVTLPPGQALTRRKRLGPILSDFAVAATFKFFEGTALSATPRLQLVSGRIARMPTAERARFLDVPSTLRRWKWIRPTKAAPHPMLVLLGPILSRQQPFRGEGQCISHKPSATAGRYVNSSIPPKARSLWFDSPTLTLPRFSPTH